MFPSCLRCPWALRNLSAVDNTSLRSSGRWWEVEVATVRWFSPGICDGRQCWGESWRQDCLDCITTIGAYCGDYCYYSTEFHSFSSPASRKVTTAGFAVFINYHIGLLWLLSDNRGGIWAIIEEGASLGSNDNKPVIVWDNLQKHNTQPVSRHLDQPVCRAIHKSLLYFIKTQLKLFAFGQFLHSDIVLIFCDGSCRTVRNN